jgi:hypothetical protein
MHLRHTVHTILTEAITRLTDGDLADYRGSHGRNFIEKLAFQIFARGENTADLIAKARSPAIKTAFERAAALNAPKQAILDRLAQCKSLFADDETFFRHFPSRLVPLFPWQPRREPIHPLEGVYLPLNRWRAPLGEGPEWDGGFGDYVDRAWNFNLFPDGDFDDDLSELIDEGVYSIGGCGDRRLGLMDHFTDDDAPAFLATYTVRLRRVLAEAKPGVGAL